MSQTIEAKNLGNEQWTAVCRQFGDASIYQAWPYEVVRSGQDKVSHLLVKQDGRLIAAAQARIVRVPYLKSGVAFIRWGPMWRPREGQSDLAAFREAIRAVREEYAGRRGLSVRILPHVMDDEAGEAREMLKSEHYVVRPAVRPYNTLPMDLRPSLDDLQKGLHHKWRYHLNKARKQNLELVEGEDDFHFQSFERVYDEMVDRKRFMNFVDIRQLKEIQRGLAVTERMRVFLCKEGDTVCAAAVCSAIGDTSIYLFGATSNRGIKNYSSYLVHWAMLSWVKGRGCPTYDLNGIDPVKNPGGYQFKAQLAATHGRTVKFVGQYDAYPNIGSRVMIGVGDAVRARVRRTREALGRI